VEEGCRGGGGRGTRRRLEEEHEAALGTQVVTATSSDGGRAQRAWPGQRRTTSLRRRLHQGKGRPEVPCIDLTEVEEGRAPGEGGTRADEAAVAGSLGCGRLDLG
jgi:hypothetical protein